MLVTGASAGIGREIAKEFASRGFDLVLVARNDDALTELARELVVRHAVEATVIAADLSTGNGPADVFRATEIAGLEIDILVNNAGVMHYGSFADVELEKHMDLLWLNVVAATVLTRLFLQPMIARGHGRILNLSSAAAFQPAPTAALYGATKAFLLSLTESLSVELRGTGVTATTLCPGFTATPMMDLLADEAGDDMIPRFLMLDAAKVAREGVDACLAGTAVHINGLPYRLGIWWERMQPRWLIRSLAGVVTSVWKPSPHETSARHDADADDDIHVSDDAGAPHEAHAPHDTHA